MQDASTYFYIVSYALYLTALVLLIMFCFNTKNNRLWAIAIVLLVFGAFLETDMTMPTFLSILYSAIMLIIFGSRGNIVYSVATVLVLLSAILSNTLNNIFVFAILVVAIFSLSNMFFIENKTSETNNNRLVDH